MQETIAVLSVADLLRTHIAGRTEVESGDVVDAEELKQLMRDDRSSEE
ncbi:hypothetical protein [Rhodococcus rhodochrous]